VIRPRSCGVEQLNNGIDDTLVSKCRFVSYYLRRTRFGICGQYQRPIARVMLFWHIRFNEKKRAGQETRL